MPTAWLLPFFLKVPQKSSTGESTIISGIKTTLQSHILVNCDHVGHFSQNRDQSRKFYGFSLSFSTTFRYMSLSMWKFCGVKATLVYFMSETVPRFHMIESTKIFTSLPYNLLLVEIPVLKRSLDSKWRLTQSTIYSEMLLLDSVLKADFDLILANSGSQPREIRILS